MIQSKGDSKGLVKHLKRGKTHLQTHSMLRTTPERQLLTFKRSGTQDTVTGKCYISYLYLMVP